MKPGDDSVPPVGLLDLALVLLKIGATGFGGAMPVLALIRGEVVERRRWISQEDFAEAVVLGQILPGPIAVDAVTHIGHRLRGWPGAVVAVLAFVLPSFLLMLALTLLYLNYGQMPQLAGALKGLGAAVSAIIIAAAYRMGRPFLKDRRSLAVLVGSMAALLAGLPVVPIIVVAGLLGFIFFKGPMTGARSAPAATGRDGGRV